jgi:hypothetical protein
MASVGERLQRARHGAFYMAGSDLLPAAQGVCGAFLMCATRPSPIQNRSTSPVRTPRGKCPMVWDCFGRGEKIRGLTPCPMLRQFLSTQSRKDWQSKLQPEYACRGESKHATRILSREGRPMLAAMNNNRSGHITGNPKTERPRRLGSV